MSGSIADRQAQLFGVTDVVCGGHGARWPNDGFFKVPAGVTILFYGADGYPLGNDVGQQVDQILNGGTAPKVLQTCGAGSPCRNYRLFTSRAAGYLNLAMSSKANDRYITTNTKDRGIHLETMINMVLNKYPYVRLHWSACRLVEDGNGWADWSEPKYEGALAKLAKPSLNKT